MIVGLYLSNESCQNFKEPIEIEEYNFTPGVGNESENFIRQGYEYLKILDEFRNVIDLLDRKDEVTKDKKVIE